jgi:hypothetical protein
VISVGGLLSDSTNTYPYWTPSNSAIQWQNVRSNNTTINQNNSKMKRHGQWQWPHGQWQWQWQQSMVNIFEVICAGRS